MELRILGRDEQLFGRQDFEDLGPIEIGFRQKQYGIRSQLIEELASSFQKYRRLQREGHEFRDFGP